ncbi:S8 family serine peptidase [Streptomyces monashensis]|uniref:S8 family serine peptidase n=1 Tax=Streptomyces monashensis TaxID=1678012 RepID=UPI000B242E5E
MPSGWASEVLARAPRRRRLGSAGRPPSPRGAGRRRRRPRRAGPPGWLPASEHGSQVDMVAPGEDIISACLESKSGVCDSHGTSDASALASASAALIWSKHPNWTNNQVLRVMLNTASKPTSGKERTDYIGYGAVRPRIALTNPGDPGPAGMYPLPDFKQAAFQGPDEAGAASTKHQNAASGMGSGSAGGTSTTTWALAGAGGVVLTGAVVATGAIRRRRRVAAAAHTPAPVPPGPGQTAWPHRDRDFGGRP